MSLCCEFQDDLSYRVRLCLNKQADEHWFDLLAIIFCYQESCYQACESELSYRPDFNFPGFQNSFQDQRDNSERKQERSWEEVLLWSISTHSAELYSPPTPPGLQLSIRWANVSREKSTDGLRWWPEPDFRSGSGFFQSRLYSLFQALHRFFWGAGMSWWWFMMSFFLGMSSLPQLMM